MTDAEKTVPAGTPGSDAEENRADDTTGAAGAEGAEAREAEGSEGPEHRPPVPKQKPGEVGGPQGPEPTRYGDWEVGGRCSDF